MYIQRSHAHTKRTLRRRTVDVHPALHSSHRGRFLNLVYHPQDLPSQSPNVTSLQIQLQSTRKIRYLKLRPTRNDKNIHVFVTPGKINIYNTLCISHLICIIAHTHPPPKNDINVFICWMNTGFKKRIPPPLVYIKTNLCMLGCEGDI